MEQHDRSHDLNSGGTPGGTALPHDRRHDLNAETPPADAPDPAGGRKASLSARSLAARGDALDASDDLPAETDDAGDGGDAE